MNWSNIWRICFNRLILDIPSMLLWPYLFFGSDRSVKLLIFIKMNILLR